jgi:hypothetical protein
MRKACNGRRFLQIKLERKTKIWLARRWTTWYLSPQTMERPLRSWWCVLTSFGLAKRWSLESYCLQCNVNSCKRSAAMSYELAIAVDERSSSCYRHTFIGSSAYVLCGLVWDSASRFVISSNCISTVMADNYDIYTSWIFTYHYGSQWRSELVHRLFEFLHFSALLATL